MNNFISINDVKDVNKLIEEAIQLKSNPLKYRSLGENKTLGLFFFNPSLRTRISSKLAGRNLGMDVIVINADKDSWGMEFVDGVIMDGNKVEHIKDSAPVIGNYCDIIGVRSFPTLVDKNIDENDLIISQFQKYSKAPIMSLESAIGHPLQSLADMITIKENWQEKKKPKIVLSWAPHIKAIPHCVANSFAEWTNQIDAEFVITHPEGYELNSKYTENTKIEYNQNEAIKDADFVYVKNWSSYNDYGKIVIPEENWMLNKSKLDKTNNAKIMHCLPVRRNVELSDYALDSSNSIVQEQANNRIYSAQIVLKKLLEGIDG